MNILFFVCDTLRTDHLGCYGYFRDTSPNIDRIAKEGVLFEDFYNSGCPTGPGFTCIYTGLHTIHHKYYRFGNPNIRQVDDTIFTIPEIMRAMGYTTVGFDNLMRIMLGRAKHFVRGYEFYVNVGLNAFDLAYHLTADQLNRRLLPWIKEYANEKFFLFVHYWDPHGPYNQPEKYWNYFKHKEDLSDLEIKEAPAGYKYVPGWGTIDEISVDEKPLYYTQRFSNVRELVDIYDGEIAYMDHAIGEVLEILEAKKVLDETLIILTSDHGEQLCQHKSYGWQHAGLHDAVTHIPLLMRLPGKLPREKRVEGFCQHIDILPTLMDLLDKSANGLDIDGQSILPLLRNGQIRDKIFMEHTSGQRAVRNKEWKLLDDQLPHMEWDKKPRREPELYNVKNDPMEIINLAKTQTDKAQELKEILHNWVRANLKEGESDPAIYPDWPETSKKTMEYGQKIRQFTESLRSRSVT